MKKKDEEKAVIPEMTPHEKDEAERMRVMVEKAKENQKLASEGNRFGK